MRLYTFIYHYYTEPYYKNTVRGICSNDILNIKEIFIRGSYNEKLHVYLEPYSDKPILDNTSKLTNVYAKDTEKSYIDLIFYINEHNELVTRIQFTFKDEQRGSSHYNIMFELLFKNIREFNLNTKLMRSYLDVKDKMTRKERIYDLIVKSIKEVF